MKRFLFTLFAISAPLSLHAITWEEWRASKFTVAELYDFNISGQFADPDGDGRLNLAEYAFDTDPKTPDVTALVQSEFVSNFQQFSFTEWNSHPQILCIPQNHKQSAPTLAVEQPKPRPFEQRINWQFSKTGESAGCLGVRDLSEPIFSSSR